MKSIIILPNNEEYNCNHGSVKCQADISAKQIKNQTSFKDRPFAANGMAMRTAVVTPKTRKYKYMWQAADIWAVTLVYLRKREQQKWWGSFLMPPKCLRDGGTLTQPCKCNYSGPMARGPTLKSPPWECDSVLVWQPPTAAESQSDHLRHLKVKCFHGKFEDPSSSLDLI